MRTGLTKRLLWAADVVLVVLVIWAAAEVFGRSGGGAGQETGSRPAAAEAGGEVDALGADNIREIVESGTIVPAPKTAPPPEPERPAVVEAEPAQIDVTKNFRAKLIGTAMETGHSYAFFEEGGKQTVTALDEMIGNARVVGIWEDRVLIEVNGQRGYIYAVKVEGGGSGATYEVADAGGAYDNVLEPGAPTSVTEEEASEDEAGGEEEYPEEYEEDIDWMVMSEDQYRDYLQNVGKYVSEIVILGHYDEEKKPDGLLLSKVPPTSEAYKRGLREGDVIKGVQGEPATDLKTVLKAAYKVLEDEDYIVDVELVRNGQDEIISYEIWPE